MASVCGILLSIQSKFPAQGSVMIPINVDIIHVTKIHMLQPQELQPLSIQKSFITGR
jgi:hypothetical protein